MFYICTIISLWIISYLFANVKYITYLSVATRYFDSNVKKEGKANVSLAFKVSHLNHAGTIALGSCIHILSLPICLIIDNFPNYESNNE